jgi:hypothetical protein
MSRTLEESRAQWFAEWRAERGARGTVYQATVPPAAVLAVIDRTSGPRRRDDVVFRRDEREVVVNPNMLRGRISFFNAGRP